jgi:hypothetical protein
VHGAHAVAVAFSAWGSQPSGVTAASEGGRNGLAHVAMRVGDCLTYVYDRAAVRSHLEAWREAAQQNSSVRLPAKTAATASRSRAGQEMALVCNLYGRQWHAVLSEQTVTGNTVITVAVGAVTVRVYTAEALRCYLLAWTQADALGAVFDQISDVIAAAPGWRRRAVAVVHNHEGSCTDAERGMWRPRRERSLGP